MTDDEMIEKFSEMLPDPFECKSHTVVFTKIDEGKLKVSKIRSLFPKISGCMKIEVHFTKTPWGNKWQFEKITRRPHIQTY